MSRAAGRSRALGQLGPGPVAGCASVACAIVLWAAPAESRELHWRELEVRARLDARGHLHVSERHQIVFDGAWNGGERSFDIRSGQDLVFDSIARLGADGSVTPLSEGGLDEVDEYAWFEPHILRWRSRLPGDPPFRDDELGYRIDYELVDVLVNDGERQYTLAHDFAFEDRPGVIEHLEVHLELAPTWHADEPAPIVLERTSLPPGETLVLTLPLEFVGAEPPQPSTWVERLLRHPRTLLRLGLGLALVVAAFALWRRLGARARALGHLEPLVPEERIDATWLSQHVLAYRPEVLGALHDGKVGQSEVAALLARLQLEGRLASSLPPAGETRVYTDLALELLAPRESFHGYERKLVDYLFDGTQTTSTRSLRERFENAGFDPAGAIAADVRAAAQSALMAQRAQRKPRSPAVMLLTIVAVLGLNGVVANRLIDRNGWPSMPIQVPALFCLASFIGFGLFLATGFRSAVADPDRAARPLHRWVLTSCLATVALLWWAPRLDPLGLVLSFLLGVAIIGVVLWMALPDDGPGAIALRKHSEAARRYFEQQLLQPRPKLNDRWFPHLVALGLAPEIEGWFRAFGRATRALERQSENALKSSASDSSSSRERAPVTGTASPDGDAPRWTGGGGQFGGGGASGTWATAATQLASGAPPASTGRSSSSSWGTSSNSGNSRSSSVSSSSSRARSGGGGGGGW